VNNDALAGLAKDKVVGNGKAHDAADIGFIEATLIRQLLESDRAPDRDFTSHIMARDGFKAGGVQL
jgi:hypothetical protein